jgi:hypothetical protein
VKPTQVRKGHFSKQSEKISNGSADVNDQFGRDWQRESEAEQSPNGNHYKCLRLFSHKFADDQDMIPRISGINRFTHVTAFTPGLRALAWWRSPEDVYSASASRSAIFFQ